MSASRLGTRILRRRPLVGCLATALALAAGLVAADGIAHAGTSVADPLARARGHAPPDRPDWWKVPDPAEIALRWQPAPHPLPEVPANSIVVQNCNDSGAGSLRQALTDANSGDTIDLTQLSCSSITLTTGSILFTQTSITLQGPGSKYLSISGNDAYAPLLHNGTGTLYINDLTVEHGMKYFTDAQIDDARGGCIFSAGSVFLSDSVVSYCVANETNSSYEAKGGAIYGQAGVTVSNSAVTNSSAIGTLAFSIGGGIYSPGFIDVSDSFIAGNYAGSDGGGLYAYNGLTVKYSTLTENSANYYCGGFCARGNVTVTNSTISNNQARIEQGGGFLLGLGATTPLTILSSTISGNNATFYGGVTVQGYDARIANSTIAFNYEHTNGKYGAGLSIEAANVDLESTIIGNNSYAGGSSPDDVGGTSGSTISGANNLIGYSSIATPSDTILLQSPMLGPLAYNGGTTKTHMIQSGSPAIDAGNDAANVSFDQRGSGFPREIGAAADIGAYELDTDDVIFANGFDP